jgi:hypothetical protein
VIKRVPLCALHLDAANARLHGGRNMEAIKSSLQRFGQREALVVPPAKARTLNLRVGCP